MTPALHCPPWSAVPVGSPGRVPTPPAPRLFQDLLDPARWRMLIQQFRYDNYRLHQLGNNSVFTLTLQAGLSAIKTPYPPCAPA